MQSHQIRHMRHDVVEVHHALGIRVLGDVVLSKDLVPDPRRPKRAHHRCNNINNIEILYIMHGTKELTSELREQWGHIHHG
jgi:hypothetical protein